MKISYRWLQDYIKEDLPTPAEVADVLTHGAYEVEGFRAIDNDTVFDIDVLPNRASDSLCHEGVARELAVLADLTFTPIGPKVQVDKQLKSADALSLAIETSSCRRALKRLAFDVEVGPSPDWLRDQLKVLGQKSINNVVDITNYLTFELGQPVHAFDYDKLAGEDRMEIMIRSAEAGEEITTLDGDVFTLEPGMPVIADSQKALDIAGIKGGQVSGIDESTTKVMLSVCSFDPATIRKTSQKLNLRTDASKRFENDVPAARSRRAMERFSQLIQEVADATIADDVLDVYPRPQAPYKVGVTTQHVNALLGTDISTTETIDILNQLGCETEVVNPTQHISLLAPDQVGTPYKYGASVTADAPKAFDCSSFVSWMFVQAGIALPRISVDQFAYTERLSESDLMAGDLIFANTGKDEGGEIYYQTKEYMAGTDIPEGVDHCGIYLGNGEIAHASRHSHDGDGGVVIEPLQEAKQFENTVGYGRVPELADERIVATIPDWRTDLRYSQDLIEEVGRVYGYDKIQPVMPDKVSPAVDENVRGHIRDSLVSLGYTEVKTYSLVEDGKVRLKNPVAEDKAYLRSTLRDNITTVLDTNETHKPVLAAENLQVFEIGKVFLNDREVFSLAVGSDSDTGDEDITEVFSMLSGKFDYDFEPEVSNGIATALLPENQEMSSESPVTDDTSLFSPVSFRTPSMYPYVLRDVAVWTPDGAEPGDVKSIIQDVAGELLVAANLFDTYEKDNQISYAFKLVFQSDERTLSDAEVNEHMQSIETRLEGNDGFSVR
ncbi:MAG: phenylalanine--tRNA ligase beta subunit-related protein [Candidatus Paceibacterota bacterium]